MADTRVKIRPRSASIVAPMLVFLDDSGDPGFKVGKGSSACFVIALVIFDDDLEAEKCAVAINSGAALF